MVSRCRRARTPPKTTTIARAARSARRRRDMGRFACFACRGSDAMCVPSFSEVEAVSPWYRVGIDREPVEARCAMIVQYRRAGYLRHALRAYGEPYGANCCARYPLPESFGEYFANDVVGAVHIRVEAPSIRRSVESTLHPPSAERRHGCRAVDQQRVRVEEAGLAGVALLGDDDPNAY